MHPIENKLRAVAADRYADGWRMPTGVAERKHVLSGAPYTSDTWDTLNVGVLWVSSENHWQVLGHRWTTDSGWTGRKFYTFATAPFHGSAEDALRAGDTLLADLLARHAAGTLPVADKGGRRQH